VAVGCQGESEGGALATPGPTSTLAGTEPGVVGRCPTAFHERAIADHAAEDQGCASVSEALADWQSHDWQLRPDWQALTPREPRVILGRTLQGFVDQSGFVDRS
jgi:hypothetical protein